MRETFRHSLFQLTPSWWQNTKPFHGRGGRVSTSDWLGLDAPAWARLEGSEAKAQALWEGLALAQPGAFRLFSLIIAPLLPKTY